MAISGKTPSLLDHDTLVMQQTTGFMSNDFDILDAQGSTVGKVETTGSTGSRLFMGNRSFDVADRDGTPLLHLDDVVNVGRDTYELTYPDGSGLATVTKRITFLRTKIQISLVGGPELELRGNALDFDFQVFAGETVAATVSRQWGGVSRGLLGHSRYAVALDPAAPRHVRLAIIGGLIALDLIRAKADRNTN